VIVQEMIEPVRCGLAESMKLSPRWAAEFRGFWDLEPDFQLEAATPTVSVERAPEGKITPEESADGFLAQSRVAKAEMTRAAGRPLERETLAAMLDEKLSRKEIRDIQSGYKDPDRFDKWISILRERVPYDDPIVLPLGEGLNVVRPRDGEAAPGGGAEEAAPDGLMIRCDCGHDFCRHDRNWKMEAAIFVRDDEETMLEVFPKMAGGDPEWIEVREFYCPSCALMLEIDCAVPGYPVLHDFLPDVEGFYRGWLGRELP
jgi:acetone carboxylase gamma subunit